MSSTKNKKDVDLQQQHHEQMYYLLAMMITVISRWL